MRGCSRSTNGSEMTNSEHVEILRQGPRIWNAWRSENPSVVPDLSGISLSIGDRQMGPINGGPINLSRAQLCDASFYFATLIRADMRGADLTNADLRGARLEGVDLTGAELSGAQLDSADLAGANLKTTNLCGASLADVRNLTADQIEEAEGDSNTVLPYDIERPLIWTVGHGAHRQAAAQPVSEHLERPSSQVPEHEEASVSVQVEPRRVLAPTEPKRHILDRPKLKAPRVQAPRVQAPRVELARVESVRVQSTNVEPRAVETPNHAPSIAADATPAQTNGSQSRPSQPLRNAIERSGADADAGDDRHITWLVGGPQRVGGRDRAGAPRNVRNRF